MERLLLRLSINVTSMFRDPGFFLALRAESHPAPAQLSVRAHLARRLLDGRGGLLDGDPAAGGGPLRSLPHLRHRHQRGGAAARARRHRLARRACRSTRPTTCAPAGTARFSEYYTANYDHAIFRSSLRKNVVFSQHNLVTDGSFNEFNVIFCRNVMIYFNDAAAEPRAHAPVREPAPLRRARARPQGVAARHAARARLRDPRRERADLPTTAMTRARPCRSSSSSARRSAACARSRSCCAG